MWSQFTYGSQQIALELDSSLSSHPVLQDVGNPSEISELFDSISYDKGASLIR
jgi:aminopeptidase N